MSPAGEIKRGEPVGLESSVDLHRRELRIERLQARLDAAEAELKEEAKAKWTARKGRQEAENKLALAEAVVEAARTIYPVARPLLWDSDGIPHFEEGEALCEPILRLDEALAVFDGLARSGTDT